MKNNLEKDRQYLRWNVQRGIAWMLGRGYRWFTEQYLPAIKRLEKSAKTPADKYLLSDAYYCVGDVHDFNDAPFAAIRAFQRSFSHNPEHAEAMTEIGILYSSIGQYDKALKYLERASKKLLNDPWTLSEFETVKLNIAENSSPLYEKEDINWKINEFLAQNKFNAVLNILRGNTSLQARQYRMCVYSAMREPKKVLEEWRKIIETFDEISMEYRDWFYIKDAIWNYQEFWKLFIQGVHKFTHGIWYLHDSLRDVVVPPAKRYRSRSNANILRFQKRLKLFAQYQLARLSNDYELISALVKAHPNWPEAVDLLKTIKKRKK